MAPKFATAALKSVRPWLVSGCLVAATTLSGCATTSGGSSSWFSGWFGKKSATASYLESIQPAKKPGTLATIGNSVKSAFGRSVDTLSGGESERRPDATSLDNPAKPSADFYVSVARLQESSGNVSGAIEQYQKGLELAPKNYACLLGLAVLYDRQGQFDQAASYYVRAIEVQPQQPALLNNLGLCYWRAGKHEEAMTTLTKAVELDPERALYRNNLANVLIEQRQVDLAYEVLAPVHGEATAHYNVGHLLQKQGHTVEAASQFRQALKADPQLVAARIWLEQLDPATAVAAETNDASPSTASLTSANVTSIEAPTTSLRVPRKGGDSAEIEPTTVSDSAWSLTPAETVGTGDRAPVGFTSDAAPTPANSSTARSEIRFDRRAAASDSSQPGARTAVRPGSSLSAGLRQPTSLDPTAAPITPPAIAQQQPMTQQVGQPTATASDTEAAEVTSRPIKFR